MVNDNGAHDQLLTACLEAWPCLRPNNAADYSSWRGCVAYWDGWVTGRCDDWSRVPESIQRAMGRGLAEDVAFADEMRAAQSEPNCDAVDAARYRALVALALKGDLSLFVALEMIDEIGDDLGVHNAMDSAPLYLGWLKRGES